VIYLKKHPAIAKDNDPFIQLVHDCVGIHRTYRLSDVLKCLKQMALDLYESGCLPKAKI
jgi:hypothetical protein